MDIQVCLVSEHESFLVQALNRVQSWIWFTSIKFISAYIITTVKPDGARKVTCIDIQVCLVSEHESFLWVIVCLTIQLIVNCDFRDGRIDRHHLFINWSGVLWSWVASIILGSWFPLILIVRIIITISAWSDDATFGSLLASSEPVSEASSSHSSTLDLHLRPSFSPTFDLASYSDYARIHVYVHCDFRDRRIDRHHLASESAPF